MTPFLTPILGFIFGGYFLSRILKRNDVADGMWGLGFVGIALSQCASTPEPLSLRAKVVVACVLIWGLRLSIYLWVRLLGKTEDTRYANWRKQWGISEPWRAFAQIFLLQGILLGCIAIPIRIAILAPPIDLTGWSFAGLTLFLSGFLLESIADAQMMAFKSKSSLPRQPSVAPLVSGLWKLCRHPNYLGEICIWWGFFFFVVDVPRGFFGILSPLLLTFLLVRVSGVPMLDALFEKRGHAFHEYTRTIPALIPFRGRDYFRFLCTALSLMILDAIWLGGVMKNFYWTETMPIARIRAGEWDIIRWAAAEVYFFLALGIFFFALKGAADRLEACFKGALLGLVIYGVYETTNIALVRDWPLGMALVDIAWGTVLCGITSYGMGPNQERI